jgi:RNase P/RNase MRP subunit POP5
MYVNRCCISWRQKCDQEKSEKILKYKDLIIQIRRMWNVKEVIPVIIGTTGTISVSLRQYLSNIPVKHEIKGRKKK